MSGATARLGPFAEHPELPRFLAAVERGGWEVGDRLPRHGDRCYGCGPDNPAGFALVAHAADGAAVTAELTFDDRHLGAPGLAHGGAIAAVLDDLYGMALVRNLVPAVTVDLAVSYRRPLHLDVPCRLRAELVDRDGRDLHLTASVAQHGEERVTSTARFRVLSPERIANRYERVGR